MVQWLYQIKPEINISAENDEVFKSACENGHLNVAQWLYQNKPNIDISANYDKAFIFACNEEHLDVAKWLCDLLPLRYHVETNDDRIIDYQINKMFNIS
jgi:ankyrin repeat protein